MATKKLSRRQKAMTLVPLAVVCGVVTANMAGLGVAATAVDAKIQPKLPDGATVPSQAIQAPANLTTAGVVAPGVPAGASQSVVNSASTSGIPSAALSAYQRAAQIIDSADAGCHIPWELIAAIGRVESDHGRYGGNVLSAQGVSTPGIYGPELDGKNGTSAVPDTDAGQLDKDPVWDRAVGPMQFIPSTWASVKVDADGDGLRNPQDIDDASLATAVYLCSGSEDLGTTAGQRSAVFRYNHSQSYVDLVLALMRAYSQGDYTAVPNAASGGSVYSLDTSTGASSVAGGKPAEKSSSDSSTTKTSKSSPTPSASPSAGSSPSSSPTSSGGIFGGSKSGGPKSTPSAGPTRSSAPVKKVPAAAAKAIGTTVATTVCAAEGLAGDDLSNCVAKVKSDTSLDKAKQDAATFADSLVTSLDGSIGGD